MARRDKTPEGVTCSFCGKHQKQVARIVAGAGVYICNECVDLCNDIMEGQPGENPIASRPSDRRLPPLAPEDFCCDICGIDYPTTTTDEALAAIATLPDRLRVTVQAIAGEVLRVRPSPEVWSPIEYLVHVRDVFTSATIRLYRTRTEDVPAVEPLFNDLRAARFSYSRRSAEAVLDEIADDVEGFLTEAGRMPEEGWDRLLRRLPGEARTARWLVRQTMHEGEHHLRDIQRATG